MISIEKLMRLTRKLYPTGRAFRIPTGGEMERFHEALAESEKQAYDDVVSILDSILPDNANFTTLDASQWETRLGMISNPLVSLSDRKLAIIRKMNHPGDTKARQSWDYLQNSLQLAGFVDIYVHEIIPEIPIEQYFLTFAPSIFAQQSGTAQQSATLQQGTPYSVYPSYWIPAQQSGSVQQGDVQQGQWVFTNKVVNYIDEDLDKMFNFGKGMRASFIVGGITTSGTEEVDILRKEEFRQLILKLKPTHSVAVLFINYA